jgi:ubiquinone/menaquinone biosynthesis C-methylase UbiE
MNTNYDASAKVEALCIEAFDKQVPELGLSKLSPQPGERVLVIGFGTAHSVAEIARAVGFDGKALGFDMSERAQRARNGAKLLPYEADSLDGIFTSYTLERLDTLPLSTVLVECKRVLRQGGRIVVIGLSQPCEQGPDCDPIYTRRMLTAAGFAIREAEVRQMFAPIEIVVAVKGSGPRKSGRH